MEIMKIFVIIIATSGGLFEMYAYFKHSEKFTQTITFLLFMSIVYRENYTNEIILNILFINALLLLIRGAITIKNIAKKS